MALGLPQSGVMKPYVKYDARAGRVSRSDGKDAVDITQSFAAIFDMERIEVGWARFLANAAPDFVMSRVGEPFPARPSEQHKSAFRLKLKLPPSLGGDVREFTSAAACVNQAVDALHDAYLAAQESKKGMLPVVKLDHTVAIKTQTPQGMTTNYKPVFTITKWVPRPAEMEGDDETEAEVEVAAPTPPARVMASADTEF